MSIRRALDSNTNTSAATARINDLSNIFIRLFISRDPKRDPVSSEVPEVPGSCSYALYIIEMRCTMGICGYAIRRCETVRIEYVIILCNIKFKPATCTSNIMHLSVLCPTTPSRAMSGKKWGFVLYKIQMHHLWACHGQSVKFLPSPILKGKYYYLEWNWTGFWTGMEYSFSMALQLDAQHLALCMSRALVASVG